VPTAATTTDEHLSAMAEMAEQSQTMYERVAGRAAAARRRDFRHALKQGLSVDELAEAIALEVEDVLDIIGNRYDLPAESATP
jgi:hypothetical protein